MTFSPIEWVVLLAFIAAALYVVWRISRLPDPDDPEAHIDRLLQALWDARDDPAEQERIADQIKAIR